MIQTASSPAHPPWGLAVPQGTGAGRRLVLATVALLVVIRLFTEVLGLLPGLLKLVDIPLLALLLAAAAVHPAGAAVRRHAVGPFFAPAVLFLGVCVVSAVVNLSRVAPGPLALFLYGFLAPLLAYGAAYRIWPTGSARALSRLLVLLGVLQLVVVAAIDLPRFVATRNPDSISGTFGENPYQLVFFLVVFAALVAGIAAHEPARASARFAPPLVGTSLFVVFLAQYRALLATTAVSMVLVGLLLARTRARRQRSLLVATVVVVAFAFSLAVVAVRFPETRLGPYLTALRESPITLVTTRLHALSGVAEMFDDEPMTMITGSGPGTFSSRAWLTFANFYNPGRSPSDPVSRAVSQLTGGEQYHTDVSDRYSTPRYLYAEAVLGSKSINFPFSSYTSLLAEVGVLGFAIMVGIYLAATLRAFRLASASTKQARASDPLPPLLLASAIAFALLLQMALLGNWLEVARITIPSWLLLAVATKEFEARRLKESR